MLKKFLREVVAVVVGKSAEPIADLLYSKKHVNEFVIAKKMDLTINQTRNILYKLSDHGLVSNVRKKDKKKGWYTYFWRIEILRSLEFLKEILVKRINQFEEQIANREKTQFYICERCKIEFNEETALLHDFTCQECGGVFGLKDNAKLLRELKRNVENLKKELELVNVELQKERVVLNKQKEKEIKKEEKEKVAKRAEAAKKRKAAKKKAEKISGKSDKKPAKKKVVKKKSSKKKIVKKRR